ncbi:hypothetical protein O7622_26705 [Micromonospora sp. WMMD1076]|uniref:hypothetical protein n=1 Tax=Micromonospora sp. WMMD1076 TaxID=3016103 RepID=UPI00249BE6ED|nr:hypothetical protein [Micromonospora sp. WMMD1076]WFF06594.1 hypothetical protein O7622_26705 [Micromonospora sp. WMMD1076]
MPAKRNPKKSRKQSTPNLDALTVTPPAVVPPTEPLASTVSPDAVPPTVAAPTVSPAADAPAVSPVIGAMVPAVAAGSVSLPESPEIPALPGASAKPPRSGPPSGRQARLGGRSQRAGQTRFYAFRRS